MIINWHKQFYSRQRSSWAKTCTAIIEDEKSVSSKAALFIGEYLHEGENKLTEGSLVIEITYKNADNGFGEYATLYKVGNNELQVISKTFNWKTQFYSFLREVAHALPISLSQQEKHSSLSSISDDELLQELKRRKLIK